MIDIKDQVTLNRFDTWVANRRQAKGKTNKELANYLVTEIWAKENYYMYKCAILEEVIERLQTGSEQMDYLAKTVEAQHETIVQQDEVIAGEREIDLKADREQEEYEHEQTKKSSIVGISGSTDERGSGPE